MKKALLILPLILLLLTNCGVQKRKYQKGYYVNWHKSNTQKDKKEALAKKEVEKSEPIIIATSNDTEITASADNSKHPVTTIKKPKQTQLIKKDEPCDELVFRDGTEVKGKVIEITPTEIKYKKCDMLDGPNYVVRKSDIFMIKYANGTREVMFDESKNDIPKKKNTNDEYSGPKTTHPMAILAFIMGLLSFTLVLTLLAATLAVVFGDIALDRIKREPNIYDGDGLARAGKIIGIVFLSIIAALLVVAIIALLIFL
jgi:hypothetical protein